MWLPRASRGIVTPRAVIAPTRIPMSASSTPATSLMVMSRLLAGQYHKEMELIIIALVAAAIVFVAHTPGASSTKKVVQVTLLALIIDVPS